MTGRSSKLAWKLRQNINIIDLALRGLVAPVCKDQNKRLDINIIDLTLRGLPRLAEKNRAMKKTNFDKYLEEQLKDPDFAARFDRAGEAWDVALQIAALRKPGGAVAEGPCEAP